MKGFTRSASATSVAILTLLLITAVATPVSAGDWVVEIFPMAAKSWGALRLNRRTGATWRAVDGTWVRIKEAPVEDGAKPLPEASYAISVTGLQGDWGAVRYDVDSGRTWHAREGAWVEMPE